MQFAIYSSIVAALLWSVDCARLGTPTNSTKTAPIVSAPSLTNSTNFSSLSAAIQQKDHALCPQCPCESPVYTPPSKWNAMKDMANAMNGLGAPYNIHGGTVLGLIRSCNIFDSDIDFAVEYEWFKANHARARAAFAAAGMRTGDIFGSIHKKGYEENAWTSFVQAGVGSKLTLISTYGVKIDVFTVERYVDKYVWGIWVHGQYYPCDTMSTGTEPYNWLGVTVNIPVPVEQALISWYGTGYMTPSPWTWDIHPFTVGSCKGNPGTYAVLSNVSNVTVSNVSMTTEEPGLSSFGSSSVATLWDTARSLFSR